MNAIFLLWAVLVLSRSLSEKSSLFGLPLCGRVHEETKDALFRPYFYSKVYEYLDIVFVALRGYPINTHFRFHHNTTLLLAYSLLVGRNRAGVWFMLSNVFMHFLLYPYLGGWAQWHSWIRKMGHVQLVVGILVSAISLLERSRGADCGGSSILDLICLVLYSSYMVLFRYLNQLSFSHCGVPEFEPNSQPHHFHSQSSQTGADGS